MKKLKGVEVQEPEDVGRAWKGVKHYDLIQALSSAAGKKGLLFVEHKIHLWYFDQRLCASVKVASEKASPDHPRQKWIGIEASNRGDQLLKFYVGATVGDIPIIVDAFNGGKYTTGFILEQEAERAMTIWGSNVKDAFAEWDKLDDGKLNELLLEYILVKCGRLKILPWSKLGTADKKIAACGGKNKTMLDVYRGLAMTIGLTSGPKQMDNLHRLHKLTSAYVSVPV